MFQQFGNFRIDVNNYTKERIIANIPYKVKHINI